MSLNVIPVTYDTRLKTFIELVEGKRFDAYVDTAGNPTIGVGFALNRDAYDNWRNKRTLDYFLEDILGIGRNPANLSPKARQQEKHWRNELEEVLCYEWAPDETEVLQDTLKDRLNKRAADIASNSYTDRDRECKEGSGLLLAHLGAY